MSSFNNKVVLIGVTYFDDHGYTNQTDEWLAVFDDRSLAEEYVIKSIVRKLPNYNGCYEVNEFRKDSLLAASEFYQIVAFELPHNPKMEG